VDAAGGVRLLSTEVGSIEEGISMRGQSAEITARILVCLAVIVVVLQLGTGTGTQAGATVSEDEAAALRGGDDCFYQQSYDCPKGPNPDKAGKDCSAKTLYQIVTGGTKYKVPDADYCGGGPDYCGIYTKNNPDKCDTTAVTAIAIDTP
jgi:hypothetical protein